VYPSGSAPAPVRCDDAALYAGWYSVDHYYDCVLMAPGAIGIHLESYSALNPREGTNWMANALLKRITVTSGAVAEPYLWNLPHPDQLLLYLFQGVNAGDAMLRSDPFRHPYLYRRCGQIWPPLDAPTLKLASLGLRWHGRGIPGRSAELSRSRFEALSISLRAPAVPSLCSSPGLMLPKSANGITR
jgi:hypothetical protein